jgi:glycosyltransferase involved in cell wall biosynthesis
MNILCIHQNFPGQFKSVVRALSGRADIKIVGLGDLNNLKNIKEKFDFPVFGYKSRPVQKSSTHHYLQGLEVATRRGQDVVRACQDLAKRGFVPDIVLGHPGWGELLFIKDVFPAAKVIGYFEFFYQARGTDFGFDPEFPSTADAMLRLRIRNTVQLQALSICDAGISPTKWQRSTYPVRDQSFIDVIHEGVDLEVCKPDPDASFTLASGKTFTRADKVVTYVSRRLEPYRGFHVFMRSLPEMQRRMPDAHFVIVGADGVSYGSPPPQPFRHFREMYVKEVGDKLDWDRVHFVGQVEYKNYLAILQVSSLHIYLTYPFVLSWSLLEAMACGAPVLASATGPVQEVITEGENGYLFDFFNKENLAEQAARILSEDTQELRARARNYIKENFSFERGTMPAYVNLLERLNN